MSFSKTQLPRFPRSAVPTAAAAMGAGGTGVVGADWGEKTFGIPGTYTWEPPQGATNICIVCVGGGAAGTYPPSSFGKNFNGGGALAWINQISVKKGDIFTVYVGDGGKYGAGDGGDSVVLLNGIQIIFAGGGKQNGTGGIFLGTNVFGGNGGGMPTPVSANGGGGAGGYLGNGSGSDQLPITGSGAAAGGSSNGSAGGGVGIWGIGSTATAPSGSGSFGSNGRDSSSASGVVGRGGLYGGGAGVIGNANIDQTGIGGHGAVRVIWGENRAFPSTNCG